MKQFSNKLLGLSCRVPVEMPDVEIDNNLNRKILF